MWSLLLVRAERDALGQAMASGASALVADLAAGAGRGSCRADVAAWLREYRSLAGRPALYVRIHPMDDAEAEPDLDAVCAAAPDGIVLPQCCSGIVVQQLGAKLAVREALHDLVTGHIGVLADVSHDMPAPGGFKVCGTRLRGLLWDDAALAAHLGRAVAEGAAPLILGRGATVLAARAAGVPAFHTTAGDPRGVAGACARGHRDGFAGALVRERAALNDVAAVYRSRRAEVSSG